MTRNSAQPVFDRGAMKDIEVYKAKTSAIIELGPGWRAGAAES